jgi:hypothetical protein
VHGGKATFVQLPGRRQLGQTRRRFVARLHQPPVDSPQAAVRAAIVAEQRGRSGLNIDMKYMVRCFSKGRLDGNEPLEVEAESAHQAAETLSGGPSNTRVGLANSAPRSGRSISLPRSYCCTDPIGSNGPIPATLGKLVGFGLGAGASPPPKAKPSRYRPLPSHGKFLLSPIAGGVQAGRAKRSDSTAKDRQVLIRMRLAARHPSNRSELPRAGFRVDGLCGRIRPTAGPEPARIKPPGSP